MAEPSILTRELIRDFLIDTASAFRCRVEYQPAGGEGDKVFPPTYEGGKYATEERLVEGVISPCVLLDSVQSQANRMEMALLEAWEAQRINLPVVSVDFDGFNLPKPLRITSLEAPHRIADAILRDSYAGTKPFRKSEVGAKLDHVSNRDATALFELCPTALVFGLWDSTGPRRGMGVKFARAMVSEIVGLNAQRGVKTSSRIDPAQIMLQAGPLYRAKSGDWTLDEEQAALDAKKKRIKLGKDGKPSEANHGNVTPTIADGGVTISKAVQTIVLSLPALRRLRFPIDKSGRSKPEVDAAARTALAALGLCAAALNQAQGCDLRSRCQLHPTAPFVWELLDEPGEAPKQFKLTADEAVAIFREAVAEAKKAGLPWMEEELVLKPSPQLAELVRKSQELAASVEGESGGKG